MAWFRKKDRPAGPEDWSGYRQKYGQECRRIWQRLVPPEGQAATVQGELLREIEKLYHEAWRNGNINWDGAAGHCPGAGENRGLRQVCPGVV